MKEQFDILLFERDENVASMLQEFMQMGNISSATFTHTEDAYRAFSEGNYAVCIISLEEDPEEEFKLAKRIKVLKDEVVLIFIGAHPSIETIMKAYSLGADDFIRKPIVLEELFLRTKAILRRAIGLKENEQQVYQIGKYTFDAHKHLLSDGDGTNTKVTTKECDLLKYLCDNANNVVERDAVLRSVWSGSFHNARSLDVYITKLRRLLENDETVSIMNIHGKGFRLVVQQ